MKNETQQEASSALTIFQPKANVSKLPSALQAELAKYRTREQAGYAPQWKPEKPGEFVVGPIASIRENVETEFGLSTVVTLQTQDRGMLCIFLGTDLKVKLSNAAPGQVYVIQFDGMERKKDNPKLKNDMKKFTVIEVLPPEAE